MEIFLGILGVIIVVMMVFLVYKVTRPSKSQDYQKLEERMIKIEGEIDKINPLIDRNFRENRKEIAENLERLQTGNEKKSLSWNFNSQKKLNNFTYLLVRNLLNTQ